MANIDLKIYACELLVDALEKADTKRHEEVRTHVIETEAYASIAVFSGANPLEVKLEDGWNMVGFLLETSKELKDLADILKDHLPVEKDDDKI